jgi:DNA (cytosine-5)-methyltransferase 1
MSWLFSQALVEEYLAANSLDGELSVQSSGSLIQQAYCAPDKMTKFSKLSRFGMTFRPLTDIPGEELSMSSVVDFHVRTLVRQEKVMDLTEKDRECGNTWRGWLAKFDPDSCSWKTPQCSLLEEEQESLQTLPRWGMTVDGLLWEQPMLEPITNETECGSLPNGETFFHTPNTTGMDGGSNSRKALRKRQEMWPTPATKGYGHAAEGMVGNLITKIEDGVITKEEAEQMLSLPKLENHRTWKKKMQHWPSPKARDWKDGTTQGTQNRDSPDLGKLVGQSKETGALNPTWVEWLMGWPLGWTDLKPLATDKSHCAPQKHGDC